MKATAFKLDQRTRRAAKAAARRRRLNFSAYLRQLILDDLKASKRRRVA